MPSTAPRPSALLVSQDLFFSSKITATAESLGFQVDVIANAQTIASKAVDSTYGCVFLDLAMPDLAVADFVAALPKESRLRVVAFGAHVHTARLDEARNAGCDEVMPRGKFSATLPEILTRYLGN